ncbi:hypothetical protein HOG48_03900 [Candidatus Peregrinibacteria bacterium]|jgi:hypothetical protein|nr:hypothetical protein [Candidatus Peregrinibacteria bacterium]
MLDSLFDREFPYQELDAQFDTLAEPVEEGSGLAAPELAEDLAGQEFHVCTVRKKEIGDLSIGTVYWLLQAAKAKRRGAKIVVTDFYDKPETPNDGVEKFMKEIGLLEEDEIWPVEDEEPASESETKVVFRRAEDVERDPEVWERFCDYVRANAEAIEDWDIIGHQVRAGIEAVIADDTHEVPPSLERLFEELATWVDGIDKPGVVQLLNHEREITAWIRRLYAEAEKEFWQVELPFKNEYRALERVPSETDEAPDLKIRLRLRDLHRKLAGTDADKEPEERKEFYESLFKDLIDLLKAGSFDLQMDYAKYGGSGVPLDQVSWVTRDITQCLEEVAPSLVPHFLIRENVPQGGKREHWMYRKGEKEIVAALDEILKNELAKERPSLKDLIKVSSALEYSFRINNPITTRLLDDRIDIEELAEFWKLLISGSDLRTQITLWGHPITTKLVQSADLSREKWEALKKEFYATLSARDTWIPNVKDLFSTPIMQRIMRELAEEEPEKLFLCAREKVIFYFIDCNEERCEKFANGPNVELRVIIFIKTFLERYLETDHGTHDEEARKYLAGIAIFEGRLRGFGEEPEEHSWYH